MNSSVELDIGPLTWVKGEIDQALEHAVEALSKHGDDGANSSFLKSARTHLHQAHGALSIVGLEGITRFSETLEQLLTAVEEQEVAYTPTVAGAARQGIAAIRHYLEDLISGQPDQPLRLLPAYRAIAEARNAPVPAPSELFFPDLSLRPPRRTRDPEALPTDQLKIRLRSTRSGFQRGLLKWLRQDPRGVHEMRASLSAIELTQPQSSRAFWWSALAFVDAIEAGTLPVDFTLRRLCARIDTQIKKLIDGSRTVAERLMRDTLYYVAIAGPAGEHVEAVRTAYHLADLIPEPTATGDIEPLRPLLRACREQLTAAMDDWNRFCAGTAAALPLFHEHIRHLAGQIAELRHEDLARLVALAVDTADSLRKAPLKHNEAIGLELATGLLLMQDALGGFQRLGEDFASQVSTVASRLAAARSGKPLAEMELPHLDKMSRRAQERLLMAQVVKEIQVNLSTIEQSLDAFFRDQTKTAEIPNLVTPIKQVQGALTVLGQDRAVAVLKECEALIHLFGHESYRPRHGDFEEVAAKLAALGFFAERLQHGPVDIDAILNPASADAGTEPEEPTVEEELDAARRLTKSLVFALRTQPKDENLRGEIKQSLEVVRENAQLVDDVALVAQANAAIVALDSDQPPVGIEAAVAEMAPAKAAPAVAPSAEAARLAEASVEEIDAELLAIFIEEAHEVLATVADLRPRLASRPHERDTLTTIRRCFHTLKGSGRMVGLADLGETAWTVEKVLNRWLQQEQEATAPVLAIIGAAQQVFERWVAQLEAGGSLNFDSSSLVASCAPLMAADFTQPPAVPTGAAEPIEDASTTQAKPEHEPETGDSGPAAVIPEPPSSVAGPETESAATRASQPSLQLVPPPVEPVRVGDLLLSPTLYDLYVNEALTHVGTLSREIGLAGTPQHPVIRAAHTLAGISATAGIAAVNRLAHALETALNRLADADTGPTESQHLLVARTVGALEGMVGAVAERRLPTSEETLAGELDVMAAELAPLAAKDETDDIEASEVESVEPKLDSAANKISEPVAFEPSEPAEIEPAEPQVVSTAVTATEATERPTVALATTDGAEPTTPEPVMVEPVDSDRRHLRLHDEIDPQLLPVFLEEAADLMREVSGDLRLWRQQPSNTGVADHLKRQLHTLKGSARMAGAMSIGELVHSMESRVEEAFAANAVAPGFLDTLDASFDRVSNLIEILQRAPTAAVVSEDLIEVAVESDLAPTPATESATAKAPAATIDFRPETIEAEAAKAMLRVRADVVDTLVNEAGEIAIARGRIEAEVRTLKTSLLDLTENVIRLRNQLREVEIQAETQMQSRQALAAESARQFDPLEFDRFTRFQELTRMMAESVNDVATAQQGLLQNLDHADAAITAQARLNRELSQALMGVRMVPFNTLAERLYRVVRQTAKETGKRANLDIRGGQTELDRSVLEKMTGPLEHLLRNAVAHGLETPEQRLAAGKIEIGEISLRVSHEGNEVVIELADDGAGLNLDAIRDRAVADGLLAADQQASQEQLTQLIFRSGFSTATELTAIAGRGIGMDVVKNEAANLGGRIEVESTSGQGTHFRIYLPLTLAITQAVLVRVGNRHYAIPSSMVAQVSELKPATIAAIRAEGGTTWLGDRYSWHYLPRLLGDPDAQPIPARRHWLLLLRAGSQHIALEADDLVGNQELVVKNVGPQLARVVGIAGATVLGDGEIALILNPIALVGRRVAMAAPATSLPELPAVATAPKAGVVMVVDDSLTVRKITGRLLAREGYHVLTAKDGVEALEQLVEVSPDVMLVDIEMPRMDGFDLTRNVRADAKLKSIPIIMITSRIADKHRNYAKEIGVNHYLGKPYDEDELLRLIAAYVPRR